MRGGRGGRGADGPSATAMVGGIDDGGRIPGSIIADCRREVNAMDKGGKMPGSIKSESRSLLGWCFMVVGGSMLGAMASDAIE